MLSLVLAALLATLSLFHVTPATAQTEVWSARLRVGTTSDTLGCRNVVGSNALCSSESVLTENEFNYGGTRYSIRHLFRRGDELSIVLELASNTDNANWPPVLASSAVLNVGSKPEPFNFADATIDKNLALWSNTGLSWSDGDMVSLSIVVPPPPPTVTLSASPNQVTEGQSVTVTAKLSRALSEEETIQVRVTRDTAEPGDVGTPTSITINPGAISGTGTITTKQDTDYEDETFTVSLGRLPSSVTAGSPSSVPVKIIDRGRTLLSSELTVGQHDNGLRGCDISDYSVDDMTSTSSCGPDTSSDPPGALTKSILTYNGKRYRIMRLGSQRHGLSQWQISLGFNEQVLDETLCLWICVADDCSDGSRLCLSDALNKNAIIIDGNLLQVPNLYLFIWRETLPGWTVGDPVSLRFSDHGSGEETQNQQQNQQPSSPGPPTVGPSTGGPSGSPAGDGGGGGGGRGLPPSSSGDEPPPEDEEPSGPDQPDACGENGRGNLERFYETTGGEQWDENENWNSDEAPQEWFGVETDEDGNVVSLRLSENSLSGDTPEELLSCLSELKELALWGNDDLSGEVPEELVLAVERAVLRDIAEMLNLNPEWFENYEDPYNFEDWHEGVTTDDDGRVVELDLPGEVPGTLISQLRKLRVITTSSEGGGCALTSEDDSSAFSLFLLALLVFAALGRTRARG